MLMVRVLTVDDVGGRVVHLRSERFGHMQPAAHQSTLYPNFYPPSLGLGVPVDTNESRRPTLSRHVRSLVCVLKMRRVRAPLVVAHDVVHH